MTLQAAVPSTLGAIAALTCTSAPEIGAAAAGTAGSRHPIGPRGAQAG